MDSEVLGVAVLGAGRWGIHLVRNFLEHPGARLVAVAEPHLESLQALAQRYDLGATHLTTDWQAALQVKGVEAVAIATPANTHYLLAQAALQHGYHVLVEKPLTLNWHECLVLCRLAEQQQRQLVVDHTYLFHPAVGQGKIAIHTKLPGDLRYGYATRTHLGPIRQDVDALWDLAIHDIAIFNYWSNETPHQVQAQGTIWLQSNSPDIRLFPQGLSDLVWVKLLYPSGLQAFIHLCWCNADKQRRLCVAGDRGTLIFDELDPTTPLTFQHGEVEHIDQRYIPINQQRQVLTVAPVEPLYEVCDHFLTCARQNRPSPISSGWVGAQLVQILTALTQSLHQGGQGVEITH